MSKKPKVLIVSTRDLKGGAAKSAFRLLEALLSFDVDAYMLVLRKSSDHPNVILPKTNKEQLLSAVAPSLNGQTLKLKYKLQSGRVFSSTFSINSIYKQVERINPDIINLHWIGDAFFPLAEINKFNRPVVWTFHDMWAITGGCHNAMDCNKYLMHCGSCPALNSSKEKDISYHQFDRKKQIYKESTLTAVTPSKWLGEYTRKSPLLSDKDVRVIPSCIDTDRFKPLSKIHVRQLLNLPEDSKIILFGAMNPQNPFKGYPHLIKTLEYLKDEDFHLVVFGTSVRRADFEKYHKVHYLGSLHDEISLIAAYNAADIFVVPSTQENLSLVIMESLSCGTPVAAFDIGGNADLISTKQNGYLAPAFEAQDLAEGIKWIASVPEQYSLLSQNARNSVTNKYTEEVVVTAYLSLFEEKLQKKLKPSFV